MLIARKIVGAVTLALVLIVAAYAVYRSSIYQECTTKTEEARQQQQDERHASLMVYVDCLGPFAHENHGPIVAVFTIVLAFSTIALWVSTRDTALAAKAAAEHIPRVERAFIHGGVHPDGRTLVCNDERIRVRFSMANYGKTPGFIKCVKIGSGELEGLSDEPKYSKDVPVLDLFFPMMTMSELRYLDDVEVTVPADGKHVVFQRVFYDDVFGNPHSSGSLHRMYVEGGRIRDEIVPGKSKYWAWD
jgi:hypothetical protein